jgi:hypothetical protein
MTAGVHSFTIILAVLLGTVLEHAPLAWLALQRIRSGLRGTLTAFTTIRE